MASSWSEENVNLNYFPTLKVSKCWYVLQFFGHWWVSGNNLPMFTCGRCCCHFLWQMLLPLLMLADVIAIFGWCCCHFCGWCYCHFLLLADVVAIFGWCYSHYFVCWWYHVWLMLCFMLMFYCQVWHMLLNLLRQQWEGHSRVNVFQFPFIFYLSNFTPQGELR